MDNDGFGKWISDAVWKKFESMGRRMLETQNDPLKLAIFTLGHPYPPSTTPLKELQAITIPELQRETHHRGRVLWLVRPVRYIHTTPTRAVLVGTDMLSSTSELVDITLADQSIVGLGITDPKYTIAIKEPYYTVTEHNEAVIRVDHLSDILGVPALDGEVPEFYSFCAKAGTQLSGGAPAWKTRGNEMIKTRPFEAAHNYTAGLRVVKDKGSRLAKDLLRNRAQAHLLSRFYNAAIDDAIYSLSLSPNADEALETLDGKAWYRAACAAYSLHDYGQAHDQLLFQMYSTPDDDAGKRLLARTKARLHEQESGEYDFERIVAGLSRDSPRVDAASYTKKTIVRETGTSAGRGLFATQNIQTGELVFCEKALCNTFGHDMKTDPFVFTMERDIGDGYQKACHFGLWRALTNQLMRNPSQIPAVVNLTSKHKGLGTTVLTVDGRPVIDAFQIHDILYTNQFRNVIPAASDGKKELGFQQASNRSADTSVGIWPHASYANHACLPNCAKVMFGDLMVVRAVKPIKAGEELTMSYIGPLCDNRVARIRRELGFVCECALCTAEASESSDVVAKRQGLATKAERFVKEHAIGTQLPCLNITAPLKQFLAKLSASYDKEAYGDVPTMHLVCKDIYTLLISTYFMNREYDECMRASREFLLSLGYEDVCFNDENVVVRAGKHILPFLSVDVFRVQSHIMLKRGNKLAAEALEKQARTCYLMGNGVMSRYQSAAEVFKGQT